MAKKEEKQEQKDGFKVSTPTAMTNTPSRIFMDAEDTTEEKSSENAPLTITISVTQQMPASTTTSQNATIPFRNKHIYNI